MPLIGKAGIREEDGQINGQRRADGRPRGRGQGGVPGQLRQGRALTTVDRPDNKQYRELYSTPEAIAALKAGQPIPSGTVLTLVQFKAKLDAAGDPEKDANGRFIKGELVGYTVMEKRAGWGAEYADDIRNGEWEYQAFKADKTRQRQGEAQGLLHLPQAARQAGLRILLRQDEDGEVGATRRCQNLRV